MFNFCQRLGERSCVLSTPFVRWRCNIRRVHSNKISTFVQTFILIFLRYLFACELSFTFCDFEAVAFLTISTNHERIELVLEKAPLSLFYIAWKGIQLSVKIHLLFSGTLSTYFNWRLLLVYCSENPPLCISLWHDAACGTGLFAVAECHKGEISVVTVRVLWAQKSPPRLNCTN